MREPMMTPMPKALLTVAALLLLVATGLGAYFSHLVDGTLGPAADRTLQTALQFHFFQTLGLLGTAVLADRYPDSRLLPIVGLLLVIGIVLFCGGLYLATLGRAPAAGRLAPYGGTCFLLAWALLMIAALRLRGGT
jgi:uncharacterized membrane protein YgdD (TMEM256/DUF423 family)